MVSVHACQWLSVVNCEMMLCVDNDYQECHHIVRTIKVFFKVFGRHLIIPKECCSVANHPITVCHPRGLLSLMHAIGVRVGDMVSVKFMVRDSGHYSDLLQSLSGR